MMKWLTDHLLRVGPGVPRNAAPKTGFALLADVLARNWWELLQLNLLYILFSLPLVTLPAAHVAATRVTVTMLEDRNVYLMRDFWEAFRGRFWRALVLGVAAVLAIGLPAYGTYIFFQAARGELLLTLPLAVSAATALYALLAANYAFLLLATRDISLRRVIRLALLGALARPLPALGAFAFVMLLWLMHIVFYPASIFMPAVLNFSFGALAVAFAVHPVAVRLLSQVDKARTPGRAALENPSQGRNDP
jgi:uncharacterized membrane protein YesL